ncbi:MAG: hypothetical protein ACFFAE_05865 [Candidatus Hodarchaeota archaeon]
MKLHSFIRAIQLIMILTFLIFSYIPFFSAALLLVSRYYSINFLIIIVFITFILLFGIIVISGIITLQLELRGLSTILFSFGILFSFTDTYLIALGVILSWIFYESLFLTSRYHQLDLEYESYPLNSVERQKLREGFRTQFGSLGVLAWIALSISWAILLFASNFYIEVGQEFGTLGISISISMLMLMYLVRKFPLHLSTVKKTD